MSEYQVYMEGYYFVQHMNGEVRLIKDKQVICRLPSEGITREHVKAICSGLGFAYSDGLADGQERKAQEIRDVLGISSRWEVQESDSRVDSIALKVRDDGEPF